LETESNDLPAVIETEEIDDISVPRNGKLTYEEVAALIQLRASKPELTQKQLAEIFGITQGQISRLLGNFVDMTKLAKLRLKANADRAARATLKAIDVAAERGDAAPGLELLDRLDVAAKRRQDGGGSARVMIVIGGQGQAGLPDDLPTIDVDPA
jgi:transcriptional regulator with XRE-family HTH domain